jgi:hypothetical protein
MQFLSVPLYDPPPKEDAVLLLSAQLFSVPNPDPPPNCALL